MKPMRDYHGLYLECHVLLLADVFEKFRNNSLKNYGLCPSHYLSAPALSREAVLKWQKWNWNLFQILTCTYSLQKIREVKFLIFLIDIVNPRRNI